MSDFCDFVPDDPSCASTEPTTGPTGEGKDGGEVMPMPDEGKMEEWDEKRLREGQIAQIDFFMIAFANIINVLMTHFRYRSDADYYSDGDVLGTNYWKMAS